MRPEIHAHAEELVVLCRRYGVARLRLFGSAARDADFDPDRSDFDFVVAFASDAGRSPLEQFFGFQDALSALFARPVDLVEERAVTNPVLKADIESSATSVYAA